MNQQNDTFAKTFFLARLTTLQTAIGKVNAFAREHNLNIVSVDCTHNYVVAVYRGDDPDVDTATE